MYNLRRQKIHAVNKAVIDLDITNSRNRVCFNDDI